MKISEINESTGTSLAEAALLDALNHHQQLALSFSDFTVQEHEQLVALLGNLDAVVSNGETVSVLLNESAMPVLINQITKQFGDQGLQQALTEIQAAHEVHWHAGRFDFNVTKTPLIYGILNVSPDSFYDGGRYHDLDTTLRRVEEMANAGVPVVEVGGQTTRPGFTPIPADTEIERVIPIVKAIKQRFPELAIAVDTYKLPVMQAVLDEGVDIVNDVNAFTDDERKLALLAPSKVGLLTMHESRQEEYQNLTGAMKKFFTENIQALVSAGIDQDRIALDEGIGYAKVADGYQDFTMMRNIDQFLEFKRPLMVAISRKGFGHKLFGLAKEDRLTVTLIAEAYMYLHGGRILRVHDIEETQRLVKLLSTIETSYWFPDRKETFY